MPRPTHPTAPRPATLTDPRSTGAAPKPRLPDVLGLRGTFGAAR